MTRHTSHYENLPQGWCLASHNSVLEISGGSQPPKSVFSSECKDGYIRLYQIRDYGEHPIPTYIPIENAAKQTQKGDILLARYGGSLGKVFIAKDGAYNVAMAKVIIKYPTALLRDFAYFFYLSDAYQNKLKSISRTAQAGFNSKDFEDLLFPIPSFAEQKRIVDKIVSLFAAIDSISQSLAD